MQNGYPSRRRSLVDDARFETLVVKQTKQSVLEEARARANGKSQNFIIGLKYARNKIQHILNLVGTYHLQVYNKKIANRRLKSKSTRLVVSNHGCHKC